MLGILEVAEPGESGVDGRTELQNSATICQDYRLPARPAYRGNQEKELLWEVSQSPIRTEHFAVDHLIKSVY